MSETIGEMILPGTYIEVRAEGLIGVSGISTGNLGVVGTANRGPVDTAVILGSYAEALETFGLADAWSTESNATPLTLTRTLEQVFKGGGSTVYAVRVANLAADATMVSASWNVLAADGTTVLFTLEATSPGTWGNTIEPKLAGETTSPTGLDVKFGRQRESFAGADAAALADAINSGSRILRAKPPAGGLTRVAFRSIGDRVDGGPDGASATRTDVARGLNVLATQPVNIVAVGGFSAKAIGGEVLAHLEATENDARDRLAVLGASSDDPAKIGDDDASVVSSPRLILVAPGVRAEDAEGKGVDLPASYAAALVAGRLATLAPHVSPTNKDVAAGGITRQYTRAEQKNLLGNRVMVLVENLGVRVLKGITTDSGAFRQVSVRRVVDFAKAGVRLGSNPYIGRLNNPRVRAALKATLDGFLSGMVLDEMLIGYKLDVSATRAQEIAGQAVVTMTLQPTFSIDFVKVIMNLE